MNFFASKILTTPIKESVDEATRKIKSNIKWFDSNGLSVIDWLNDYKPIARKVFQGYNDLSNYCFRYIKKPLIRLRIKRP